MVPRQTDFLKPFSSHPITHPWVFLANLINPEIAHDFPVQSCNRIELFGPFALAQHLGYITGTDWLIHFDPDYSLFTGNPIAFYVNETDHCITNYTLPGHALYPGKITRCIEGECNKVKIKTYGEGLHYYQDNWKGGLMRLVNKTVGTGLFEAVDERFADAFQSNEVPPTPPIVKPNVQNEFENKTWLLEDFNITHSNGESFTVFKRSDNMNFWNMQDIHFTLNEDNTFQGEDILGNAVIGTWWTDGDSIAMGYERCLITDQQIGKFTVEGVLPVVFDGEIMPADYTMSFISDDYTNTQSPDAVNNIKLSCFPNPASTETNVNYYLDKESEISLNLFSVTGELIKNIEKQSRKSMGHHQLTIDTAPLLEGVYLIVLNTGHTVATEKFTIIGR